MTLGQGPSPYGDDKAMRPDVVEQQTKGFLERLEADSEKAKDIFSRFGSLIEASASTMSPDDFRKIVVEATAPMMEELQAIRKTQVTVAAGLIAFRAEVLARLPDAPLQP